MKRELPDFGIQKKGVGVVLREYELNISEISRKYRWQVSFSRETFLDSSSLFILK